ncbi:MAG TPA: NAD(P)-dependent oxidoreductase [Gemmatimonadales bacterium]|nr:NAD(P)-dependent oxidoreductase [Gemmatimonadales bacterium]
MARERVGFIGTGVMGASMAGHLLEAGHPLGVHNRTRARAEELVGRGARWHDTPRSAAAEADIVITIVGYPQDVEEVYFGEDGVLAGIAPGGLVIDMTTSSPTLAGRIHAEAAARGVASLDAPVSGGDRGAREGTLSIMVGGEPAAFARAEPLFDVMGATVVLQGGPGAGQHAKMSNQIAIAAGMIGVSEAMAYAEAAGLDPFSVLESIESGAAGSWSLSNLMPRALRGDLAPGFYVKHFLKDMGIAIASAEELGIKLPGLKLAKVLYDRVAAGGGEDLGTQALLRLYLEEKV